MIMFLAILIYFWKPILIISVLLICIFVRPKKYKVPPYPHPNPQPSPQYSREDLLFDEFRDFCEEEGYFDEDNWYDINEAYNEGYEQAMEAASMAFTQRQIAQSKSDTNFWTPEPDYLDEFDYLCPDCEHDLLYGECEHQDDWLG